MQCFPCHSRKDRGAASIRHDSEGCGGSGGGLGALSLAAPCEQGVGAFLLWDYWRCSSRLASASSSGGLAWPCSESLTM
jgi:hypothetical protein